MYHKKLNPSHLKRSSYNQTITFMRLKLNSHIVTKMYEEKFVTYRFMIENFIKTFNCIIQLDESHTIFKHADMVCNKLQHILVFNMFLNKHLEKEIIQHF